MNPEIKFALEKNGLTVDSVHIAICQAYIEEERRYEDSLLEESL